MDSRVKFSLKCKREILCWSIFFPVFIKAQSREKNYWLEITAYYVAEIFKKMNRHAVLIVDQFVVFVAVLFIGMQKLF